MSVSYLFIGHFASTIVDDDGLTWDDLVVFCGVEGLYRIEVL